MVQWHKIVKNTEIRLGAWIEYISCIKELLEGEG